MFVALVALGSACRREAAEGHEGGVAPSASVQHVGVAPGVESARGSSAAPWVDGGAGVGAGGAQGRVPLQLLRFSFTSEVKGKEPVDRLERGVPGERVYAHLAFRNRGDESRPVHVVFRVNGERRTKLDLKVEPSWSYRTWGFNTLKVDDKGELTVTVTDDEGLVLVEEKLPVGPITSGSRSTRSQTPARPSPRPSP